MTTHLLVIVSYFHMFTCHIVGTKLLHLDCHLVFETLKHYKHFVLHTLIFILNKKCLQSWEAVIIIQVNQFFSFSRIAYIQGPISWAKHHFEIGKTSLQNVIRSQEVTLMEKQISRDFFSQQFL